MKKGRFSRAPLLSTLTAIAFLGACGRHGSRTPLAPAPFVVGTTPGEGETVEPDALVMLELSSPASSFAPSDVVVSDGGNLLPGTLARVGNTASWSWVPDYELPRGCPIEVATAQQGVVLTFRVRDIVIDSEFELPGEQAFALYSWPNGRRALLTALGRVFEITPAGPVERYVTLTGAAGAYGDGDFIDEQVDGGVRYCVRGNLDGRVDRVPTPLGVSIGGHNARGDVVAFVPSTVATPSTWGLWRLLRTEGSFTLAGQLTVATTTDVPSIEADATVSLAYLEPGVVRLSRFALGDLTGEHDELPRPDSTSDVQYAAAADGRGLLAFLAWEASSNVYGDRILRVARREPGAGLRLFQEEIYRWAQEYIGGKYPVASRIDALSVGEWGSACIVLAHRTSIPPAPPPTTRYEIVRVEPDDRFTAPSPSHRTRGYPVETGDVAHRSPLRAEQWAMRFTTSPGFTIALTRSRPDANVAATIYQRPPSAVAVGAWHFAFDDSGRAVVALTEGTSPVFTTRILVWN